MKRPNFTVTCSDEERRDAPAKYKIAAEWVGGGYTELKTYGFADDTCLERVYRKAEERLKKIRPLEGEVISPLRIYLLEKGRHDYELKRLTELEAQLGSLETVEASQAHSN